MTEPLRSYPLLAQTQPVTGDVPVYDEATDRWVPGAPGGITTAERTFALPAAGQVVADSTQLFVEWDSVDGPANIEVDGGAASQLTILNPGLYSVTGSLVLTADPDTEAGLLYGQWLIDINNNADQPGVCWSLFAPSPVPIADMTIGNEGVRVDSGLFMVTAADVTGGAYIRFRVAAAGNAVAVNSGYTILEVLRLS